ncbi:heptosyltransferase [Bdellovibrio bacteriovorus W]|nr:heptosyltransferase [Bdellovibrio bacteriovorus W]
MDFGPAKNAKFLIIRFSAFGDVVQTLSVPAAIKNSYPEAEVHWVSRRDMQGLLVTHPQIKKVWSFERKSGLMGLFQLALEMRRENYTHIYDAHNNLRSRVLCLILRPFGPLSSSHFIRRSIRRFKRILLFQFRINKFEMPFSGQRDLLEPLKPWGISKVPPAAPQLFITDEDLKKAFAAMDESHDWIALAPSAAHILKRWPVSYWKDLIAREPTKKFILLGGPEDKFLEEIAATAADRVKNLAGKISLTVSAGVVAQSKLLISNDTWLLHAAEQLGKPAIALMGPAPFGFPSRATTNILERDLPCRPCSKHGQGPCVNKEKFHQCMVDITPSEVASTMNEMI